MKNVKAILSLILVFAMMMSMVVLPTSAADVDVWDGTSDTSWYNDTDVEFTITTAAQLAGLAELVNSGETFKGLTIKLGANIQLQSDPDMANFANWGTEAPANDWTAIGAYNIGSFQGTFDGQGYTISGMYATNASDPTGGKRAGLFGFTKYKVNIENLTMTKCYTKADTCAGTIVGFCSEDVPSFKNVTTTDCVVIGGGDGAAILVGKSGGYSVIDIENCSIAGTVTARKYVAGFVGYISGSTNKTINVTNTATDITVVATDASSYSGGLFGTIGRGSGTTFTALNVVNNDGVARTIKVNVTGGRDFGGIVGYLNCATIGDITFDGVTIDATVDSSSFATSTNYQGIAALVGYLVTGPTNSINVKDTTVTGTIYAGQNSGVVFGRAAKDIGSINITNFVSDVDFNLKKGAGNTQCVGGIAGLPQGAITSLTVDGFKSTNTYTITDENGATQIGAIAGGMTVTTAELKNLDIQDTVTNASNYVSGLFGTYKGESITVADSKIAVETELTGNAAAMIAGRADSDIVITLTNVALDGKPYVGNTNGKTITLTVDGKEARTITFVNEDDTVISSAIYFDGDTVVAPEAPTKAADETYRYVFAGWDSDVVTVAGDATYKATFEAIDLNTEYTIKFVNADGSPVAEKAYKFGETVELPENPTKAADETYTYEFAGWDKEVVAVDGDATYTATYKETYIDYTITFVDEDGVTVLATQTYHYGDTVVAPADPTKAPDAEYRYEFAGWTPEFVAVAGDATYKATYTSFDIAEKFVIKFVNEDGTLISEAEYKLGDEVVVPTEIPTKAEDETYTYEFKGWTPEVTVATGAATYTAEFTAIRKFIWGDANGDGSVDNKDLVRLKKYFADLDGATGESSVEIFAGADANGDGKVDNKDLVRLKKYFAGLDGATGESDVVLGPEVIPV